MVSTAARRHDIIPHNGTYESRRFEMLGAKTPPRWKQIQLTIALSMFHAGSWLLPEEALPNVIRVTLANVTYR